jgi:hypothetical protein
MTYLEQQCAQAAKAAGINPQVGVDRIVSLINACENGTEERNVLDAATKAGFHCEYWPTGIRVTWVPKK